MLWFCNRLPLTMIANQLRPRVFVTPPQRYYVAPSANPTSLFLPYKPKPHRPHVGVSGIADAVGSPATASNGAAARTIPSTDALETWRKASAVCFDV